MFRAHLELSVFVLVGIAGRDLGKVVLAQPLIDGFECPPVAADAPLCEDVGLGDIAGRELAAHQFFARLHDVVDHPVEVFGAGVAEGVGRDAGGDQAGFGQFIEYFLGGCLGHRGRKQRVAGAGLVGGLWRQCHLVDPPIRKEADVSVDAGWQFVEIAAHACQSILLVIWESLLWCVFVIEQAQSFDVDG